MLVQNLAQPVPAKLPSAAAYSNQPGPGPARKLSTNLYDIYDCWVYSE